uniref:Ig-like domain-containing protein n=1 Tax=Panagrolaimus sp. PS1159 TaxID=55785 RepID=A0AC35FKE1_9BILA
MVKTIWAKAQQPITLPCDLGVPPNGNYELEWRKEGSLIFNAYGNDPGFTVAELQGEAHSPPPHPNKEIF